MDARRYVFGGVRALHRLLSRRELPDRLAVYFHSLQPEQYAAFAELVEHIRRLRYVFVGPDEFLARAEGRLAFFSFDDNYRAWFDAIPLLDQLQLAVTFYVNAGPLRDTATPAAIDAYFDRIAHRGERVTLSRAELRALDAAGHTIGSHTAWHLPLAGLSFEAATASIAEGKRALEELLDKEVTHFSYPFGMRRHFPRSLPDYCRSIGIRSVAAAIPAMQHAPHGPDQVHRSLWRFELPAAANLDNLRIDGQLFERATGRSAVG